MIGRVPAFSELNTSPEPPLLATPGMKGPDGPTCRGPSSPISGLLKENRGDGLRKMLALLGELVANECALGVGASDAGCPKLTGVESECNEGKPAGRKREKRSSVPAARPCNANDVNAENPRRERSSHDELSVSSNIVSS
jgi:hypothetical protein